MPRTKPTLQTLVSLRAIAMEIEAQRATVDAIIKLMEDNKIPAIQVGTYKGFKDGLTRMSSFTSALGKAVTLEKEKLGQFLGEQEEKKEEKKEEVQQQKQQEPQKPSTARRPGKKKA